jgi:hypothetical protein
MRHDPDPRGLDGEPIDGWANRRRHGRRRPGHGGALMAPKGSYRWTEARRAEVEAAIRASRTRAEAAGRIGITANSLDSAAEVYGFRIGEMLGTAKAEAALPYREAASQPLPRVVDGREQDTTDPPPVIDWRGARPASTGSGLERRLVLGDLHIPFHSLRACAAVLALARSLQPHRIIQLGDLFNMGAVSHHPRPFGGRENHSRSMIQGRAFLEALRKASPGSDMTILLGNHDLWGAEYEDEHPELAGAIVPEWLDGIGARIVGRDAQPLVLGPVAYRHGYGGGEHFAKRYAIDDGPQAGVRCIVVGHHHTFQRFHAKNGVECWGAGWLGESRHSAFHYAKNPRGWEVGVLVQDVMGDRVTTTPVRIENGAALFGGRLVQAA